MRGIFFIFLLISVAWASAGPPCNSRNGFSDAQSFCTSRSTFEASPAFATCFNSLNYGSSVRGANADNTLQNRVFVTNADRVASSGGLVTQIVFGVESVSNTAAAWTDRWIRFCPVTMVSDPATTGFGTYTFQNVANGCRQYTFTATVGTRVTLTWNNPGLELPPNGFMAVSISNGVIFQRRATVTSAVTPVRYQSAAGFALTNSTGSFTLTPNAVSTATSPLAVAFTMRQLKPDAPPSCDGSWCHWESATQECKDGLQTTCAQSPDQTSCTTGLNVFNGGVVSSVCGWSTLRGGCYNVSSNCDLLTSTPVSCMTAATTCLLDFTVRNSEGGYVCTSQNARTVNRNRCTQFNIDQTSVLSCPTTCYLDPFAAPSTQLCFDNAWQARNITSCSGFSWSAPACLSHICQWSDELGQCYPLGGAPTFTLDLSMVSPQVIDGSALVTQGTNGPVLTYQVSVPGGSFNPYNPDYKAFGIGVYNLNTLANPGLALTPGACFTSDYTRTQQSFPQYQNSKAEFLSLRESYFRSGNLSYTQQILNDMEGTFVIGGNSPVSAVGWSNGNQIYTIRLDMNNIRNCPGVNITNGPDAITYSIVSTWITKLYDPNSLFNYQLFSNTYTYTIRQFNSGTFTLTTDVLDQFSGRLVGSSFLQANSAGTLWVQQMVFQVIYGSAYNSSYVNLPRSVADFTLASNCYSNSIVSWTPTIPCVTNRCSGLLVVQSTARACVGPWCFATCSGAAPDGSNPLDAVHGFSMSAYACMYNPNSGELDTGSCFASRNGVDSVSFKINNTIILNSGELPGPVFKLRLRHAAQNYGMNLTSSGLNFPLSGQQQTVALNDVLQTTIGFDDLLQGSAYHVRFTQLQYTTPSNLVLDMLDPNGEQAPFVTRLANPVCQNVHNTGNCDSYAIIARDLQSLLSSNTFTLSGRFIVEYPLNNRRRLLQAQDYPFQIQVVIADPATLQVESNTVDDTTLYTAVGVAGSVAVVGVAAMAFFSSTSAGATILAAGTRTAYAGLETAKNRMASAVEMMQA